MTQHEHVYWELTLSSGSSIVSPTLARPERAVPVSTVPCPLMAKQWSMANLKGPLGGCGFRDTHLTISCMTCSMPWVWAGTSAVPAQVKMWLVSEAGMRRTYKRSHVFWLLGFCNVCCKLEQSDRSGVCCQRQKTVLED